MVTEIHEGGEPQYSLAAGRRWLFNDVVVDEASLELFVAGKPVKIDRKPLEVLLYFLNHVTKVVTKDELQDALWPGRILTENVLTRTISILRQAIGDQDKKMIATIHGFGYKFVADLRIESLQGPSVADLELGRGQRLPWKSHWLLAERLGKGGAGEIWLARHEKTQEPTVIKFAKSGTALGSFRREVTLSRVLRDSLGVKAPVARLKDWAVERPPYYLEVEYVNGRDLESWIESQGGFAAVPLSTRLELVAQIAEAVGAAHSVGVLHKDLKPGNVLIDLPQDSLKPSVKLCDFGSGLLLTPEALEQLRITRLGLTQESSTGLTPLYLAPELLEGESATAKSDIYSLGLILFQMVVGSFNKSLAPGWEAGIPDDLLVEDIRSAAAGDPQVRLGDAATLAARLLSLEERRASRLRNLQETARSERYKRFAEDLRRIRRRAFALTFLAGIASIGGILAFVKSKEAEQANATATAINDFLTEDVLGIDPSVESPHDASYQSLLEKASAKVDLRFANRPEAAAPLHYVLGRRFQEVGQLDMALQHYQKAAELQAALHANESDEGLLAEERLANSLFATRQEEALERFGELISRCTRMHGALDLSTLLLRVRVARLHVITGNYEQAEASLRDVLEKAPKATEPNAASKRLYRDWIGIALTNDVSTLTETAAMRLSVVARTEEALGILLAVHTGDYADAEQFIRKSMDIYSGLHIPDGELTAENNLLLGYTLAFQQKNAEAEAVIQKATSFFDRWLPKNHYLRSVPRDYMAVAHLQQGRWSDAIDESQSALTMCMSYGCPTVLREEARYDLAQALMAAGRPSEAIEPLKVSLRVVVEALGEKSQDALKRRISLIECLLAAKKVAEALMEFEKLDKSTFQTLPRADHLVFGEYCRLKGLIYARSKNKDAAIDELTESQRILRKRLGDRHWKTQRVAAELRELRGT